MRFSQVFVSQTFALLGLVLGRLGGLSPELLLALWPATPPLFYSPEHGIHAPARGGRASKTCTPVTKTRHPATAPSPPAPPSRAPGVAGNDQPLRAPELPRRHPHPEFNYYEADAARSFTDLTRPQPRAPLLPRLHLARRQRERLSPPPSRPELQ